MRECRRTWGGVAYLAVVIPPCVVETREVGDVADVAVDVVMKSGGTLGDNSGRLESSEGRETVARFNAFYDFAFPRVYRYAQRRMDDEAQAQALCRLVFIRAMTSSGGHGGGLDEIENRLRQDEAGLAFWLFCLARRTADELCEQLREHPELLAGFDLDGNMEDPSLEILRAARTMSKTQSARRTVDEPSFESS